MMDLYNQGMDGPTRPAPVPPGAVVYRYSPITNWNNDPFGSQVFEPTPMYTQKKKPPPRPPPPKINKKAEVTAKPIHFMRKPTVLSSLLHRKNKNVNLPSANQFLSTSNIAEFSEVDSNKTFPKCERANIQTAPLIDLSSPPSSPTFTTRSSSDGISIDSFGSDATTSTGNRNAISGGNASQAESGFEDDFDIFLTSRKQMSKEDTMEDLTTVDPFSPQPVNKPAILKKPVISKDFLEVSNRISAPSLKGPTIIRAKPARPKPPDNSALLKSTFGSTYQLTSMSVNTTTPIQRVSAGLGDYEENLFWDRDSPDRERTPPMPTIPPPPPPEIDDESPPPWARDFRDDLGEQSEPYAIALYDYCTDHPEDLYFSAGTRIALIRRVNDQWLSGRLGTGTEGLFPSSYVQVKVPLRDASRLANAVALYDFEPAQQGDLPLVAGDSITILAKVSDEWCYGETNGLRGNFPLNYVRISLLPGLCQGGPLWPGAVPLQ